MTAQEIDRIQCAIRHIKTSVDVDEWAVEIAADAMMKQIPKKPTIKQDKYNENLYTLYCPTCGSYIGMYNKRLKMSDFYNNSNRNICNRCGRAIDCEVEA